MVKARSNKGKDLFLLLAVLVGLILINIISGSFFHRFDLTKEKRFTLSKSTEELLNKLDDVVYAKIYLNGDLPPDFKRLRSATRDMLLEFKSKSNNNVHFEFIDPQESENADEQKLMFDQLVEKGLKPINLQVVDDGEYKESIRFPGVIMTYNEKEFPVSLLESQLNQDKSVIINNSIGLLEYKLAQGIEKLLQKKKPKIAVLDGHGELDNERLGDLMYSLRGHYIVDRLNIVTNQKIEAFKHPTEGNWEFKIEPTDLFIDQSYDVVIIPNPTLPFKESQKYKIDQYIMNGGQVIWLIDPVQVSMDSLKNNAFVMAEKRELNLDDQLFKYGARLNADLVQDLRSNPIPIVIGQIANTPQMELRPWVYYPVIIPNQQHPTVKNLDGIALKFASTIDTVGKPNGNVKKIPLLTSSDYSRFVPAPHRVSLQIVQNPPPQDRFNQPNQIIALLMEGEFESVFKNRLAAETMAMLDTLSQSDFKETSEPTKMIIIADGDLAASEINSSGTVLPLGYYGNTKQSFANKTFLTNAIEYLLDENGVIDTRSKEVKLRLLDIGKVKEQRLTWQLLNVLGPIVFLLLFGIFYALFRKRKYAN